MKMPHCWKSHVVAHMYTVISYPYILRRYEERSGSVVDCLARIKGLLVRAVPEAQQNCVLEQDTLSSA